MRFSQKLNAKLGEFQVCFVPLSLLRGPVLIIAASARVQEPASAQRPALGRDGWAGLRPDPFPGTVLDPVQVRAALGSVALSKTVAACAFSTASCVWDA